MNLSIRKGVPEDARGVVEVTTFTWLTTYDSLMPSEVLENRVKTMNERVPKISQSIREKDNLYVALDNNKIIGVVSYGKSRNDKYLDCGEIYSLYVLKAYQGLGLGKELFMRGIKELINKNYCSMILNVLEENRAIEFYKKFGGVKVGTRQDDFGGIKLTESIVFFDNLAKIYSDFNVNKK